MEAVFVTPLSAKSGLRAWLCAGVLASYCCCACSFGSHELALEPEASLSMEELISVMNASSSSLSVEEKRRVQQVSKLKACVLLVSRLSGALRELRSHLKERPSQPRGLAFQLAQLSPAHCSGPTYQKTMELTQKALNQASTRAGLILPLSGDKQALASNVAQGAAAAVKAFVPGPGPYHPPQLIIKDSQGSAEGALQALAELVFYDEVALILGGLSLVEASALAPFSKDTLTPLLLLNKDRNILTEHPFVLQIYPNEYDLAKTLAEASKKRGFRHITILKPVSGKSDRLCEFFTAFLKKEKISAVQELAYEAGDYPSMEKAIATITQTGSQDRRGELAHLTAEARAKAQTEGVSFNSRSVVLAAKIKTDAIFIPDHFQMVRYFVKLLKYHGVEKIPLIGTPEWRSEDLITPWEPLLEGAIFADFIGSYQKLPAGLKASALKGSEYLVAAASASLVDFQMIGYRAARLATQTLSTPFLKRRFLLKHLRRQEESDEAASTQPSFYSDRTTWWPTFLIAVGEQGLSLATE